MKKYLVEKVKYLGRFSAEEVDNLDEWIACVGTDDGNFDVFVEGDRKVILWGDCILCPVDKEDRVQLLTGLRRVQFYTAAISRCNDPKRVAKYYLSWEEEINADGGDLTEEGKLENDIFDAMLEDESQKVWDWFSKLKKESEEEEEN